jgi:hypothetical protein
VAAEATRKEFSKSRRAPAVESGESEEGSPAEISPQETRERWLLRFVLESDEHVAWVAHHLQLEWIENSVIREIVGLRLRTEDWHGLAAWLAQMENPPWVNLVTEIVAEKNAAPAEANLKGVGERVGVIKRLRDEFIRKRLASLNQRLTAADLPEETLAEIHGEIERLRQLKKQPLAAKSDQDT